MINRIEQIKAKGFNMVSRNDSAEEVYNQPFLPTDFSKIKVGLKTLDDAIINLSDFKKVDRRLADKAEVLRAIHNNDYETMREISNIFFKTSGIYSRLCRYMAYLYRYDWMITPYINSDSMKDDKVLEGFDKALLFLDNFEVKKFFG